MTRSQAANITTAVVLIAVSVWMMVEATGFRNVGSPGAPGPGRLPVLYAALLCLCSLAIIVQSLRHGGEARQPRLRVPGRWRVGALMALCVLYVLAISLVGYLAASAGFVVAAIALLSQRIVPALITAVVLVPGVYVLFHYVLSVPLP